MLHVNQILINSEMKNIIHTVVPMRPMAKKLLCFVDIIKPSKKKCVSVFKYTKQYINFGQKALLYSY